MRLYLKLVLEQAGMRVDCCDADEVVRKLGQFEPDLLLVDLFMPGMDGLTLLDELKKHDDDLPVLMVTAFASVETAIAAMKRGAFDYITKPFKNDEVLVVVHNAVERRQLLAENAALRQSLRQITQDARAACDAAAEMEASRSVAGEIAALERRSGIAPAPAAATLSPEEETAVVANRKGGRAAPP